MCFVFLITLVLGTLNTSNNLYSYSGIATYLNLLIYYFVFNIIIQRQKDKNKILINIIYSTSIVSVVYIIVESCFFDERIGATIGYPNAFALTLLVTIILASSIEYKYSNIINTLLITSIILTGSRLTWALLIVYLLIYYIKIKSNHLKLDEISLGIIFSTLITSSEFLGLLLCPFVIIMYNLFVQVIRNKKARNLLIGIITIIILLIVPNNTIDRIKNISTSNGSLNERIVTYEDAVKIIKENPKGMGINSYQYSYSKNASAFYDVKYLHNSVLNIMYEGGILALLAFIAIIIYINYLLIKNIKNKDNIYYFIIANMIIIHSLFEFDFVYSSIIILLSLMVSMCDEDCKDIKKNTISIFNIFLVLSMLIYSYLGTYELMITSNNESILKSATTMIGHDFRSYLNYSKNLMKDINSSEVYENIRDNLIKAKSLNTDYSIIDYNLATVYLSEKDYDKAIESAFSSIENDKYYFENYKLLLKITEEAYDKTKDAKYLQCEEVVKEIYNSNIKALNKKNIYLKNQLPGTFEDLAEYEYKL